eukprot:jgi/Tetstr1/465819/TSEL_010439.t1
MRQPNTEIDFQLTFSRALSSRLRSRRSSGSGTGEEAAAPQQHRAGGRGMPGPPAPTTRDYTDGAAVFAYTGERVEYVPMQDSQKPLLAPERSLPTMRLMEQQQGSSGKVKQGLSVEASWSHPERAGSLAEEASAPATMPWVSIPTMAGMDALPSCASQDELEAELAKCVGVPLHVGSAGGSAQAGATSAPRLRVGSLLAALSDAEFVGQLSRELGGRGALPALVAGLDAMARELQAGRNAPAGEGVTSLLSEDLEGSLGARLQGLITTSSPIARQERPTSANSALSSSAEGRALSQLWRRMKQMGWLPGGSGGERPGGSRAEERTQRVLADLSMGLDSQALKLRTAQENGDLLREQMREARQKIAFLEDRAMRIGQELEKARRAAKSKGERIEQLESEATSSSMAQFGDLAGELGAVRAELGDAQARLKVLQNDNAELRRTVQTAQSMRGEADARAAKATRAVSDLQQEVRELAAAKGRLEARLRDSEVHALHARIQEMERSREVSVAQSRLSHYPTGSGAGLLSDSDDDVSELSAETLLNELDVEFYEEDRDWFGEGGSGPGRLGSSAQQPPAGRLAEAQRMQRHRPPTPDVPPPSRDGMYYRVSIHSSASRCGSSALGSRTSSPVPGWGPVSPPMSRSSSPTPGLTAHSLQKEASMGALSPTPGSSSFLLSAERSAPTLIVPGGAQSHRPHSSSGYQYRTSQGQHGESVPTSARLQRLASARLAGSSGARPDGQNNYSTSQLVSDSARAARHKLGVLVDPHHKTPPPPWSRRGDGRVLSTAGPINVRGSAAIAKGRDPARGPATMRGVGKATVTTRSSSLNVAPRGAGTPTVLSGAISGGRQ